MPCWTPLKAYRGEGGRIVFDSKKGWSDRPLELPCGQCSGCRVAKSEEWALRCVHEASMFEANCFVTLTYSDEFLPEGGSLRLGDWQKFAKRVRKNIGPFRFLHCGEYGEENLRPHYHACMFGLDFCEDREVYKYGKPGETLFTSDLLTRTWGLGHVTLGSLTFKSAAYVARYCLKKATGDLAEVKYERVDPETGETFLVRPEYATMSRRPGIGSSWFDVFYRDVFPADEVVHQGRRFRPPKFYDSRLSQEAREVLKRKRIASVKSDDVTPERLKVREKVAAARMAYLRREI